MVAFSSASTWLRFIVLASAFLLCSSAQERHLAAQENANLIYISQQGNDSWSGRIAKPNAAGSDGPLATLEAARDAARKRPSDKPREIVAQGGQYFFSQTVTLDARDNGLTLRAAAGEKPAFIGGRRITGWQKDGDKFWAAALADVAAGKWDFRLLVVNGRMCSRARLPEKGTFTHLSKFDVPWMSTTGGGWKRKPTSEELTTMLFKPEDLGSWFEPKNAEVTVYHMWDESMIGVKAVNPTSHALVFSSPLGHPAGAFGVKKYVVWNLREGMTTPGQWYLDRAAGKAVYWPLPGEDMAKAEVLAPTVETIIRVQGAKDKPAHDIAIEGIAFTLSTTLLKAGGFGAGAFGGAISLAQTRDCRLSALEVFNVGGQGVNSWDSDGLRIERCHVHHTGANGVKWGGAQTQITDNHVHDVGRAYPSAMGIFGGGKNSLIAHNEIHETPYTAINGAGEGSRVESNLIYHAMLELHDGGGIYIFAGKNTVLRGNFIRDIPETGGYGASAYYLDERSEGCLVEGNLSVNIERPSHNHMAKNNTIRGNVFITTGDLKLTFPKSTEHVLEKNIIQAGGAIRIESIDGVSTMTGNIFYSAAGKVEAQKFKDYSKKESLPLQPGKENSLSDPMLVEYKNGVVKFAPQSPAKALGITAIDVSKAGVR
ncbi:MAG: right-handed parallel beta-helix repeat-containing protein [Candidatus Sumerlaeota bacterium]|nr:right-handed parallel beta-helix repeat-containing protein [Candidatus Sumerlaeota bacterium]